MVCSACAHAYNKYNMVRGGGVKTMVTRDEIIKARELEKKTLKAQAIADTQKYLEGDFDYFLNEILVKDGKDAATLAIAQQEKYGIVFFTPKSKINTMHPPLYDLEYFLQEIRNNGFEVIEDKCYVCPDQKNIILKI